MKLNGLFSIPFVLLLSSVALADDSPTFDLRFGVLGGDSTSGKLGVAAETQHIPMKHCKTGARFGYSLRHNEGRRFSTYAVFYPPTPVKRIETGLWGTAKAAPTEGLTSNASSYTGYGVEEYCFTEGDPVGEWKVEIFVNAVRFKVLTFTATE